MRLRAIFLICVLAELASLAGYFFPWLNTAGFFLIVAAVLILSLRRLEYGLYFALADLILGGKNGALFSLQIGGFFLSVRMAIFIVVMAVWAAEVVSVRFHNSPSPGLRPPSPGGRGTTIDNPSPRGRGEGEGILKWWGVLGVAVAWGMIVGLARGNGFGNVFLDANGYFYAALVLPAVWVLLGANYESVANLRISNSQIRKFESYSKFAPLTAIFLAATTLLALKTLFAVYWFTHAGNNFIAANLVSFYRWVRDTGVGEITWLEGNFARVFFQSHVYNVVAFFILLATLHGTRAKLYDRTNWRTAGLLVLNVAVIIVSLSRSIWIGVIGGLGIIGLILVAQIGPISRIRQIGRILQVSITALLAAVVLIFLVSRFPFPRPSPADLTDAARSRLEAGDAGQSRFNLLPPLMTAIRAHPILGSGFGTTVNYISNDPRIREVNRDGKYTTYAFEWGWLDLWLKTGIIGLIGLLGLIGHIGLIFYRKARADSTALAALAVLAALAAINIFTPYLNHPLGLGILALLTVIAECDSMDKVVILAK